MIRRLGVLLGLLALLIGGVFALGAGGDLRDDDGDGGLPTYEVVFENAFGLTTGADLRAAGVQVGSVDELDVERKTGRAIITVKVTRPEFGKLRKDVKCTVQPQSLIGEYFMDCDPGTSTEELPSGTRIPVTQTSGTVPPDLVQGVLTQPYRQRLATILMEFGAAFGARGPELSQSIRSALPALKQTDEVLSMLARQKDELEQLTADSDTVLASLAGRRDDVARFVAEARDTAQISASRDEELKAGLRTLPAVLRELRPTLRDLGTAAQQQTPALRDLRLAAAPLTRLARDLGPFADATTPALKALGTTSAGGREPIQLARSTVSKLRTTAGKGVEPLRNGRFVLEHLDDTKNGVEPNPLAPDQANGFSGLQAFLTYFFVQTQGINIFDQRGHALKLNVLVNECSKYASANTVRANPGLVSKCSAALGDGPAEGIDVNQNTRGGTTGTTGRSARAKKDGATAEDAASATPPSTTMTPAPTATIPAPSAPAPSTGAPATPSPAKAADGVGGAVSGLLDYLMGG